MLRYFLEQERQRVVLEEKYSELSNKLSLLEKELQQLRPLQSTHANLQRQYVELQESIQKATEEARRYIYGHILQIIIKANNLIQSIIFKSFPF